MNKFDVLGAIKGLVNGGATATLLQFIERRGAEIFTTLTPINVSALNKLTPVLMLATNVTNVQEITRLTTVQLDGGSDPDAQWFDIFTLHHARLQDVVGYWVVPKRIKGVYPSMTAPVIIQPDAYLDSLKDLAFLFQDINLALGYTLAIDETTDYENLSFKFPETHFRELTANEIDKLYPFIDLPIAVGDYHPTTKIHLYPKCVFFSGNTLECTYGVKRADLPMSHVNTLKIVVTTKETINKVTEGILERYLRRVDDDLNLEKFELGISPEIAHQRKEANKEQRSVQCVAALMWRANPKLSLNATIDSLTQCLSALVHVKVPCVTNNRNADIVTAPIEYHQMFTRQGIDDNLVLAYHKLELAILTNDPGQIELDVQASLRLVQVTPIKDVVYLQDSV